MRSSVHRHRDAPRSTLPIREGKKKTRRRGDRAATGTRESLPRPTNTPCPANSPPTRSRPVICASPTWARPTCPIARPLMTSRPFSFFYKRSGPARRLYGCRGAGSHGETHRRGPNARTAISREPLLISTSHLRGKDPRHHSGARAPGPGSDPPCSFISAYQMGGPRAMRRQSAQWPARFAHCMGTQVGST